jgi:cell fate (sporulation/competence/biofilm development) regulator YmcA (YheA/YmcA/DUF963 family)
MTNQEFQEKVREMRFYQKTFFSTRRAEWLTKSKRVEKEIDEFLEGKISLFDEQ